ncbi:MAG: PAS domain-containing protein [Betaproteobacteria bacterium]|nr:PAS domain-containing protein [Betaproteobacteria bacterium]
MTPISRCWGIRQTNSSRMTYVDVTPGKWHAMEAEIVASQIIPSGRSEVYEKEYVRKDGTTLAVELRTILLRDNEGRPEAMWAIVRDVTERKQAENRLRAAFHYARSLLEASLDPMVTISAGGKIMDANKATETATGISRETIIGSDFCDYFTEPEKARAGYQQVFSMGYVTDYPLAIRHVSGVATDVLYNASIYRDESGNIAGVFAAARDITKLKSAQRNSKNTNHEILMLGQMADLLQSCHSAEESFPIITATMAQLFPESSGSCFIIDEAGSLLEEVSSWGDATPTSISRPMIAGLCVGDTCTALDSGSSSTRAASISGQRMRLMPVCRCSHTARRWASSI